MNKKRRIPALLLALIMAVMLVPTTQAYATSANLPPISVTVNGQLVNFDGQTPIMVDNRVLVPVRGVFEMMGFTVTWDDVQRIARLTRSDITVVIPAASTSFVVNNVIITPEVPQRMVGGRLLLPLRAVAEAIGGVPNWDAANRRAMITTPLAPSPTPTPSPTPAPNTTPVPLLTAAPRYEGSVGFALGGNADMLGIRYTDSIWGGGWSHHNLGTRFATLTGTIGRLDGSGAGARTIRFIGDNHVLASYTVTGEVFTPINVAVDVRNITVLRIEIDAAGTDGVSLVLGTPMLHPTQATAPIPTPRPSPTPTPTPAPLLTAAPRTDGSAGFATGQGGTIDIQGQRQTGAMWGGGWSTHHLNRRFATLTGTIGRQDGIGSEARTIRFIGDGVVLNTFTVTGTDAPRVISVNVRDVTNLRIEIADPGVHGVSIVFGNTMLNHTTTATPTPTPTPTPQPLLTAAPRVNGSAGFGFGAPAYMQGIRYNTAIFGGGWSTHNLNGQFTTLTGIIGRQDGTLGTGAQSRTITFTGDGNVIATFQVSGTDAPRNISVNVQNVNTLTIEIATPGANGVSIVLGNAMVVPTTVTTATPTPAPTAAPLLTAAPRTNGTAGFATGGDVFMHNIRYTGAIWGIGSTDGWSTHNLNRRFTTLTGVVGRQDGLGTEPRTIRFIGDNNTVLESITLGGADALRNVSINVSNVTTLRIEITAPGANGASVFFGNTMLHPTAPATSPTPLLTAAPRVNGSTGFGTGTTAHMNGVQHTGAIINNTATLGWSTHNLGARFHTLTATIGRMDGQGSGLRRIVFIGDGNILASGTIEVHGHSFTPVPISIDVRNITELRIEVDAPGADGVTVMMVNATLHPTAVASATPAPLVARRTSGTANFGQGAPVVLGGVNHINSIIGTGDALSHSVYHLNNQFTTLEATLGRVDIAGNESRYVRFINHDTGAVIRSYRVYGPTFAPRPITIPVHNVVNLRVEIYGPGAHGVTAALGNPTLR